jgi:hypothetical protein
LTAGTSICGSSLANHPLTLDTNPIFMIAHMKKHSTKAPIAIVSGFQDLFLLRLLMIDR